MDNMDRTSISYFSLLICLLAFVLVYPFLQSRFLFGFLLNFSLLIILLASIPTLFQRRKIRKVGFSLGFLVFIFNSIPSFYSEFFIQILARGFSILFFSYIITIILRHIFKSEITNESILGALCVYLLGGIVFALIYAMMELCSPGSFGIGTHGFQNFLYYSYVTMTTLGYGDITPLSPLAQSFAILEAIIGQFYIATVIARLVAMNIAGQKSI